MAAHERPLIKTSIGTTTLLQQLATVLPLSASFKIYHLSTPPTRTTAIYSAPPGARPDRTYCESHFLTVSITTSAKDGSKPREVLAFAIEILIYSTAYDTTFFVSKADSTGHLHHLSLPKGTPSPIRDISGTFLRHLIRTHQRTNIRSVISLFARAQDQYLFPGSVEYSGKHVLDDRGLVRWWCRVLDPLIEDSKALQESHWDAIKGYLIVPGLDNHETLSYLPRGSTNRPWTVGHPLLSISRHSDDVPPRCLIPHFPDDPKARFLDELDDETTKGRNNSGQWKSIKTIDQFWDMMAFRQECSAGRLVGFIWIVFSPKPQHEPSTTALVDSHTTIFTTDSQTTDIGSSQPMIILSPLTAFTAPSQVQPMSSPQRPRIGHELRESQDAGNPSNSREAKREKKKLTGPIIPRQPRIKTENKNYLLDRPEETAYYTWPAEGRGHIIVDESDYKRVNELLLRLDFANLELATSSSNRWINEVRSGARGGMREAWGQVVTGSRPFQSRTEAAGSSVNTLSVGLVRKKRKGDGLEQKADDSTASQLTPQVNVLSGGMVRKKAKV